MDSKIAISINPGRVLFGLSRIGYTTTSALCDIIDNSIRAQAKNVHLLIKKIREDFSDAKGNNVSEYLIIDDGIGMDEEGIKKALTLGSSDEDYGENSLSKFGLGLKSAAFSQGDQLEIISASERNNFKKYVVSLPKVQEENAYFADKEDLLEDDLKIIAEYIPSQIGTIVRVSHIRKNNHPSVKNTIKELNVKLGVIYAYFIEDENVNLFIGSKRIESIDPLFVKEAELNGNLNENDWEGTDVRWIEKLTPLTLDNELDIKVEIEITQLPYPPIFKVKDPDEKGRSEEIREKYLIGARNYGFYVYRNKRLISWASQLEGIIPYDQDFYAFRGRIFLDDSADDFFNIDVKKSTITLSEEAWNVISDFTKEAKSKSKKAWNNAGKTMMSIINKEPNEIANKIIDDFEQLEILPGDDLPEEVVALERIQHIKEDMESKVQLMARMIKEDNGEVVAPDDMIVTGEEKEIAVKGERNPSISKIFRVTSVIDNLLWEPYHDTDLGSCVRINKLHRFARLVYEDNRNNQDLQIIFDLMLLQFADAELYAYKNITQSEYEVIKKIITEFRRITSEFLANMCRKLENKLPPNFSASRYD